MRRAMPACGLIHPPRSQVKRSMMGPPQKAQTTVPGFTYPFVPRSMRIIRIQRTITCTVPTVRPDRRDSPCMKTVNVSVPSSERRKSVTPRWAVISPDSRRARAFAQPDTLLPEVSDAKVCFLFSIIDRSSPGKNSFLYIISHIQGIDNGIWLHFESPLDSENPLAFRPAGFRRCYSYLKE